MLFNMSPEQLLYTIPAIVIAIVLHELGHALVAGLLGDDTARLMGRYTLNPLKHLDPLGFIFMLFAGFGWAKPVIFNVNKLKYPHVGPILVALAGPMVNLLLAMLCLPIFLLLQSLGGSATSGTAIAIWQGIWSFTGILFLMNLGLFVFNLIPLPPLDGSYVLFGVMPNLSIERKMQIYQIGTFVLLGILIISAATKIDILPIGPMIRRLGGWMLGWIGMA